MYLDGASVLQLKNFLESNHIKTLRGKDEWSTDTIKNMLRNEKYAGDVIYQKTLRTDPISKRTVINREQSEQYLFCGRQKYHAERSEVYHWPFINRKYCDIFI